MKRLRHIQIIVSVVLLSVFPVKNIFAQQSLLASGGSVTENGVSVSYSLGLVTYHTSIGNNASVSEGMQYPFEIFENTTISTKPYVNLSFKAYPNPATDRLIITLDEENIIGLKYELYDMVGQLLKSGQIENRQTVISTTNLLAAAYSLIIAKDGKKIQSFKVIKK
jgi:hypothetical protein